MEEPQNFSFYSESSLIACFVICSKCDYTGFCKLLKYQKLLLYILNWTTWIRNIWNIKLNTTPWKLWRWLSWWSEKNLFDWSRFWHNQQLWNYGERFEIIGKRRATSLGSKAKKDTRLLQKLGNVVTESIFPYGKSLKLTIEVWIQNMIL